MWSDILFFAANISFTQALSTRPLVILIVADLIVLGLKLTRIIN
jgi:hypothetical protein